eukprot:EG_transcript_9461
MCASPSTVLQSLQRVRSVAAAAIGGSPDNTKRRWVFLESCAAVVLPNQHFMVKQMQILFNDSIQVHSLRPETLPVVQLIRTLQGAHGLVLASPADWWCSLFLPAGATVVTPRFIRSAPTAPSSSLDWRAVADNSGVKVKDVFLPRLPTEPTAGDTSIVLRSLVAGIRSTEHLPPMPLLPKVLGNLTPVSAFLYCDALRKLLHQHNGTASKGWWKKSYRMPEGVLKVPRMRSGAHHAQLWHELYHLRNLTPPTLRHAAARVRGLCLDPGQAQYALLQEPLPGRFVGSAGSVREFKGALDAFLGLWEANQAAVTSRSPLFFFNGDGGAKNWRFTTAGRLRMFDFDSARWILTGTACSKSAHCTSGAPGGPQQACQGGRCRRLGMAADVAHHLRLRLTELLRGLPPALQAD